MKKYFGFTLLIALLMIVGVYNVKAGIRYADVNSVSGAEAGHMTADLKFIIDGSSKISKGNSFTIIFHTPSHIVDDKITVAMKPGWEINDESSAEFTITDKAFATIKYTGDVDIDEDTVFAVASYVKDDNFAENCGFKIGMTAACFKYNDTTFTDKNGSFVDEDEFYADCYACVAPDGVYISNNKVEDYHGRDGKVVTKEEYDAQCGCREEDGKYYSSRFFEISKEEYEDICLKPEGPKCEIDKDGKYYDNDGNEVSEEEYKKACGCRIDGDKYYNSKNEEITKEEYDNQCQANVNTGSGNPYLFIAGGLVGAFVIFMAVRNKSKLRKI